MNNLKTVIIEDELKSIEVLNYMLNRHVGNDVSVVATFESSQKALEYLNKNKVDLVLLDIQMPGMDGFELLDRVDKVDFDLIFITAFNNYATKAFRYYAVDYLLKPVIAEELIEAIKRVKEKKGLRYNKEDLIKIFTEIDRHQEIPTRLAVPTREGVEFIQLENILRLEADGNYTFIYLRNKKKLYTSKTLKTFDELLPKEKFYRPHQSHMIRIESMKKYIKTDGGYIVMEDGARISISRSKRQEFSDRFY